MKRFFRLLGILAILSIGLLTYFYYIWFVRDANNISEGETIEIYIPTGTSMSEFYSIIVEKDIIENPDDFEIFTVIKRLKSVQPGRYILHSDMTCNRIVNMFRSGLQTPVKVVITPSRLPQDLAGKLSYQLELDSITILKALVSDSVASVYDFSSYDFYTLFIPDTYEMYWNSSVESLLSKMKGEYDKFWNAERVEKANSLQLTPKKAVTLASIVYSEQTQFPDERKRIAGLYLNRLRIGMLLQSDPTLIFASQDFTKKRVLNKDKEIESPYNTYMYLGLPPGPIYSPDKQSIDAVLNAEVNKYIYMCAKADFSGYHAFATNLRQHNNNARQYQRALNNARIYH